MLPRSVVKDGFVFTIRVKGDSMKDAGILDGDRVQVGIPSRDGNIVIVSVANENTVKAYSEDEQGNK